MLVQTKYQLQSVTDTKKYWSAGCSRVIIGIGSGGGGSAHDRSPSPPAVGHFVTSVLTGQPLPLKPERNLSVNSGLPKNGLVGFGAGGGAGGSFAPSQSWWGLVLTVSR